MKLLMLWLWNAHGSFYFFSFEISWDNLDFFWCILVFIMITAEKTGSNLASKQEKCDWFLLFVEVNVKPHTTMHYIFLFVFCFVFKFVFFCVVAIMLNKVDFHRVKDRNSSKRKNGMVICGQNVKKKAHFVLWF